MYPGYGKPKGLGFSGFSMQSKKTADPVVNPTPITKLLPERNEPPPMSIKPTLFKPEKTVTGKELYNPFEPTELEPAKKKRKRKT